MPIIVEQKPQGDFTPAPAGTHHAVLCDVVDLGDVETEYQGVKNTRHMVRLTWQLNELNPDNNRRYTVSARYTLSLHEKASLTKVLRGWLGRVPEATFDLETLLGHNGLVCVVHNEGKDKFGAPRLYANVDSVQPLIKSLAPIQVTPDYVRVQDRPATQEPRSVSPAKVAPITHDEYAPATVGDDADIPF